MRGVNKVIIVGNLGADPEHRTFSNGGSVTNISVATSEQWTDKQTGEKKEATEWHRIALFNRLGEIAAQYLRKGSQVYIEGSLRTRKWQDQNGQERYITEIRADNMQMLGNANGNQSPSVGWQNNNNLSNNPNDVYGSNNQNIHQNPNTQNSYTNYNNHNNNDGGYSNTPNSNAANNFNNQNSFANNTPTNQSNQTSGNSSAMNNNQGAANPQTNLPNQNNPQPQSQTNNSNSSNSNTNAATTNNMPMSDAPVDDDIPF